MFFAGIVVGMISGLVIAYWNATVQAKAEARSLPPPRWFRDPKTGAEFSLEAQAYEGARDVMVLRPLRVTWPEDGRAQVWDDDRVKAELVEFNAVAEYFEKTGQRTP